VNVSEAEILSLLYETFRRSAELCDALAVKPARGPIYRELVSHLGTAENCCRQISYYRQDARWLTIGGLMQEAHKRAGGWLRDRTMPRTANSNLAHPLFVKLAENLRHGMKRVQELQHRPTGKVGMILPEPLAAPIRTNGRPVAVKTPMPRRSQGGIIIPDSVALH
jgi:hypothetical protein